MSRFTISWVLWWVLGLTSSLASDAAHAWETYGGNAYHNSFAPTTLDSRGYRTLWQREYPVDDFARTGSSSVGSNGTVYISTSTSNPQSYAVEALDLANGQTHWRAEFDSRYRGISFPTIAEDTVFVHLFGHSFTSDDTPDPALYALDAATGATIFSTTHEGQSRGGGQPVFANGRVFTPGGLYGGLDAFDAITGEHVWHQPLELDNNWLPATDGQHVYVYEDESSIARGRLFAFDAITGSIVQEIADPGGLVNTQTMRTPVLDGLGRAYVSVRPFGLAPSRLLAFDLVEGDVDWQVEIEGNVVFGGEIATDGQLLVAMTDGHLHSIDAMTGHIHNSLSIAAQFQPSLLLTDSHVVVSSEQGGTTAFDRNTWEVTWNLPEWGRLAISDDVLLVTNRHGITALVSVPEPAGLELMVLATILAGTMYKSLRPSPRNR